MDKKLILASASPRRREILDIAGYKYEAIVSNAEEITSGDPYELARENALAKALEVFERVGNDSVVVGADTVVCLDGEVLGKPKDEREAFLMLSKLSGSGHEVVSGYAVVSAEGAKSDYCVTYVRFRELTDDEINAYISTKEPMDKAGAYGIQERACIFAESVVGDFFNIIGLPIAPLYPLLKDFGISPQWQG